MDNKLVKRVVAGGIVLCLLITGVVVYMQRGDGDIIDDEIPSSGLYIVDPLTMEVIKDIQVMEDLVEEMLIAEEIEVTNDTVNQMTLAFIRSKRYGYRLGGIKGLLWAGVTGEMETEVGLDLGNYSSEEEEILAMTDQMDFIVDTIEAIDIDFPHMVAVIDLALTDSQEEDYSEEYYDYFYSWGGDLETFLTNMGDYGVESGNVDYDAMRAFAEDNLGGMERSNFSMEDYYADIDGVNVAALMSEEDMKLSTAMTKYYGSKLVEERYGIFIDTFGGEEAFEEAVNAFMFGDVPSKYRREREFADFMEDLEGMKELVRMLSDEQSMVVSQDMKRAASEVFIDKILER